MRPAARSVTGRGTTATAAVLLALGVTALAWVEPVETVRSDAALTLVAAQALVDHGTLALDPYRGDPRLTYDLARDYRVRRRGGSLYYFAPGAQVLAAPFVFVARRLGFDMLRPRDEAAVQNALSALLCGLDLWLLFLVLRALTAPAAALGIAAVTVFGSPLVSTLATSLWGAGFAVALLLVALGLVVRHATGAIALPPNRTAPLAPTPMLCVAVSVAALVAAAYLCRPAAGCFLPGLAAYAWAMHGRPSRRALLFGFVALAAALALLLLAGPYLPNYYRPTKLLPQTPLPLGLYGTLLSPSRGLLVFCPFVAVVAVGSWLSRRGAAARAGVAERASEDAPGPHEAPLLALAWVWLLTQVLLVSVKGNWWGGNSYGPRLLTEALPATAVLAALAWRRLAAPWLARRRRALAAAYLALGAVAVALHSGQGLFNGATQAWNRGVDPGSGGALVLCWRYPQFLATSESVRQRDVVWQERRLRPLRPGDVVGAVSRQVVFVGWHPYEHGWRPSGRRSAIRFHPAGFDARGDYVLELRGRVPDKRPVGLRLDGRLVGEAVFTPPEPHVQRFVVPGAWLHTHGEVELAFDVPSAARVGPRDARVTGLDFHALRIAEVRPFKGALRFDDDLYFMRGFADAQAGGRWTRDHQAEVLLPLARGFAPGAAPRSRCRVEVEAGANGAQEVDVALDGATLARWSFDGPGQHRATAQVAPARLRPGAIQRLTLRLPQAHALPSDPRRLGLFFFALRLECS